MARSDDRTHIGVRLTNLHLCALYRRTITLTCRQCSRVRRLDAVALWWLFACRMWDDRLPRAIGRLCCDPCRAAGTVARFDYEITREPPDADQPPYPDEREWKKIVSRYRS